jgi:hypothetical protein
MTVISPITMVISRRTKKPLSPRRRERPVGALITLCDGHKDIPGGDDQDVPSLPDLIFQN